MKGFVCVHVGAGKHSTSLEKKYTYLCQQASKHGISVLAKGGTALDAVTEVTMMLEDSPLTNAGLGSNLSIEGRVECDASVMDGTRKTFGACGAVAGVKNPVLLARRVCDQQLVSLSLGRVPPSLLAGEGAVQFATEHNIPTVDPDSLISEKALKTFKQCKRKLAKYEDPIKKKKKIENSSIQIEEKLDTVGAISVDNLGNIAVACSSGGVLLKHSGRIGQAAVLGAGCWANSTIGVVSTGCGEHLIATGLAREAVHKLQNDPCPITALKSTIVDSFIDSPLLVHVQEKLAGLLVIQMSKDGRGEMLFGHTTESMCIGYMAANYTKPKSCMSRLEEGSKVGLSVKVEGLSF